MKVKYPKYQHDRSDDSYVVLDLPWIPRVGEHMELSFLDTFKSFTKSYFGHVWSVEHIIDGQTHDIYIYVNPHLGDQLS